MNVHAFNLLLQRSAFRRTLADGTICLVTTTFKCLSNKLFSYCGENTLSVNKMSQIESQIKSYYEFSI